MSIRLRQLVIAACVAAGALLAPISPWATPASAGQEPPGYCVDVNPTQNGPWGGATVCTP